MSVPIQPLGDAAMLAHGAPAVAGALPVGVTDVVPAFGQVGVYFDPTQTTFERVTSWVNERLLVGDAASVASSRVVEIPTVYDAHFGPDLAHVATSAGLSVDEVVSRHLGGEYTVGAVGFKPGFPYLIGLPDELQTPRRASPRTRVPAGSVGIGGPYTGVYPAESPGGWNLIGRTPLRMFDDGRNPPSLVAPGDRVRFLPIDKAEFKRLAAENQPKPRVAPESESPILKVVSAGALTTTQSLGLPGWRHVGVTPGGAMDPASLRLANLLVENDPDVPSIEATLTGPVLECLASTAVGVAGAVPVARRVHLSKGDRLDLRRLVGGARAYVALPGGVDGPLGRAHGEGQKIGSLDTRAATRLMRKPTPAWAMSGVGWKQTLAGGVATLRVLRGPQAERFDDEAWRIFLSSDYRASPKSSRMGVRLDGPELATEADDLPSQPVCCGAIQVPPGGQPIVLGADGQTLGGYPVIAVVASADWPVLGQLAPGDAVRFVEIDLEEAARLRHAAERALAIAAVGINYRAKDS